MTDFFNDVFDSMMRAPVFGGERLMKTDIYEKDNRYYLEIDLPGYKKEDVSISLYNGDLTVEARGANVSEDKKLLHQERYHGNCSRTFYVGTAIKESDIHASFNNGVLIVDFPTEQQKQAEEKKFISIL